MLAQCCPIANSNAGLRAGGLRAEGLPAEAVKHEWLGMYDNCGECMIVYSWGFLLNMLVIVSALLGNTFLFRLCRTRSCVITLLVHLIIAFCDLEDRRRISWWAFSRLYYVDLATMILNLSIFQVAGVWVLLFLLFCCVCWWMTDVWLP